MKIIIEKDHKGVFFFTIVCSDACRDEYGYMESCKIIDDGWNNITLESEALCRANSLRSATGWEVVKDYES